MNGTTFTLCGRKSDDCIVYTVLPRNLGVYFIFLIILKHFIIIKDNWRLDLNK